jgi:Tfp pilus tip-associated adhesin PilY1
MLASKGVLADGAALDYDAVPPVISIAGQDDKPNILLVLDNSGSMNWDIDGLAVDPNSSTSRRYIANEAIIGLIDEFTSNNSFNMGLMAFGQSSFNKAAIYNYMTQVSLDPDDYGVDKEHEFFVPVMTEDDWTFYYNNNNYWTVGANGGWDNFFGRQTALCNRESGRYICYDSISYDNSDDTFTTATALYGLNWGSSYGNQFVVNYVTEAWSTSVTGKGKLHVGMDDLNATQVSNLKTKLGPAQFSNSTESAITPLYTGGGTPVTGALSSANDYFAGTLNASERISGLSAGFTSTNVCTDADDYVVLITDGLANVSPSGSGQSSVDAILGAAAEAEALLASASSVKTFVIGFAFPDISQTILDGINSTCEDYDNDPDYLTTLIEDGRCTPLDLIAAAGGTDKFYEANSAADLQETLAELFSDIVNRASSGTGASVSANNSRGEGAFYQALYVPESEDPYNNVVSWVGVLNGLFIDQYGLFREDTNGNAKIDNYDTDKIVEYYYDAITEPDKPRARAYLKSSTNPDIPTGLAVTSTVEIEDLNYVWSARDQLADISDAAIQTQRSYTDLANNGRKIYTSIDGSTMLDFTSSPGTDVLIADKLAATEVRDDAQEDYDETEAIRDVSKANLDAAEQIKNDKQLELDPLIVLKDAADLASSNVTAADEARSLAISAANNAATAQTNAQDAADAATTALGLATTAASDAATAKTTAKGIADAATAALGLATTAASDAATAKTTAKGVADAATATLGLATTAASDAATVKTTAKGIADGATATLGVATTAASDAATAKTTAKGVADAATLTMNTAYTSAYDAAILAGDTPAQATVTANADGAYLAAKALSDTANGELATATTASTTADGNLTTATNASNTANSALTAATTASTTADGNLTTATNASNTANSALTAATTASTTADGNLTTATNASSTANSALTAATTASTTADGNLTTTTNASNTANSALTAATTVSDAADAALIAATTVRDNAVDDAQPYWQAWYVVEDGDGNTAEDNYWNLIYEIDVATTNFETFLADFNPKQADFIADKAALAAAEAALQATINALSPVEYYAYMGLPGIEADKTVRWIRGEDISGYRARQFDWTNDGDENPQTWRLGDIIHSTPVVVASPAARYDVVKGDKTYAAYVDKYYNRRHMVYVGGNDGMLHAFNSGFWNDAEKEFDTDNAFATNSGSSSVTSHPLGSELWAYVPKAVLPHLQWLTSSSYSHTYYVDGEPASYDVNIFTADDTHPNGWGTILVVPMRFGGGEFSVDTDGDGVNDEVLRSSISIFDITNPEAAPVLMAEISNPDLGFTTSKPALVKARLPASNGFFTTPSAERWLLAFGSGPNVLDTATSTSTAKLFLYDLETLSLVSGYAPLDLGDTNSYVGDISTVDWNSDYVDDTLYFGVNSGLDEPDSVSATTETGRIARVRLSSNDVLNFNEDTWLSSASAGTLMNSERTMLGAPVTAQDNNGRHWVYGGTGRLLVAADNISDKQQLYYGVMEPVDSNNVETLATVNANTLEDVTNVRVFTNGEVDRSGSTFQIPGGTDIANFSQFEAAISAEKSGWFHSLAYNGADRPSGRNVNASTRFSSLLFYTEYLPSGLACYPEGDSELHVVYYKTGTATPYDVIGIDATITKNDGELVLSGLELGQGLASTPTIIANSSDGGFTMVVQKGDGVPYKIDGKLPGSKGGRESWREIDMDGVDL